MFWWLLGESQVRISSNNLSYASYDIWENAYTHRVFVVSKSMFLNSVTIIVGIKSVKTGFRVAKYMSGTESCNLNFGNRTHKIKKYIMGLLFMCCGVCELCWLCLDIWHANEFVWGSVVFWICTCKCFAKHAMIWKHVRSVFGWIRCVSSMVRLEVYMLCFELWAACFWPDTHVLEKAHMV